MQRNDDKENTIRKRLEIYHSQTEPLVSYYKSMAEQCPDQAPKYNYIDGLGGVDTVRSKVMASLV